MKFQALLFGIISYCLLATPAQANVAWKFDRNTNKLRFRTDAAVQPKSVMLFNPTRLIIDLPGIKYPKPTVTEKLTGNFRSLRVGQFDGTTTRIVLEIQPGFTLDPNQVKFTGENPIDWYVNLPIPERGSMTIPSLAPRPNSPR